MIKYLLLGIVTIAIPLQTSVRAQTTAGHPRLMLTPKRLAELQHTVTSTHPSHWNLVLASADEFTNRSIPYMQNANNDFRVLGDTLPVLGLVYRVTGDTRYLDAAIQWVQSLLDVPNWNGSQNLGRSSWMVGCALIYDWLFDELGLDLRQRMRTRLIAEARHIEVDNSDFRALSNHLLIETTAMGMTGLALQGEDTYAERCLEIADGWTDYIITHAPQDGSWGEGVQYWQYGLGYFLRFLEASVSAGSKNYYPGYSWLSKTGYFPIYFSLPNRPTEVINFGDCSSKRYLPSFLLYVPAKQYGNAFFQDFGVKMDTGEPHKLSWMDFLSYDVSLVRKDIHQLPTLHHFSDNDFVTMRSSWEPDATLIGFRSGPAAGHRNQGHPQRLEHRGFGPGHGQPDINSFNIYAQGR